MTRQAGAPDDFGSTYRLLAGAVIPRPIAWTATRSTEGEENLAPFSFFNVVTNEPPVVAFMPQDAGDDLKDTARNALDTGAFVVHITTPELAEAMNATSATLDRGDSEFDHADLTAVDADRVDAPRVAEAAVALECELYDSVEVGRATVVFGEVVWAHVDDDLLDEDGRFDVREFLPVGRLSAGMYCDTEGRFEMERPP